MINLEQSKGALVYLPAGVRLYQWDAHTLPDGPSAPSRYRDTTKPTNVLLVQQGTRTGRFCEVLYAGERWGVMQQDIYPIKVEKNEQR